MRKHMTITYKTKTGLVVPESIRRAAGHKNGDRLHFQVSGNAIIIVPESQDPDDVLTLAEAKKVRLGMRQIKEGKFKLWRDVKHELGR